MTALKENIDWVGYVDWNIRDFHSYDTPRGATYNSYLIRDRKTALIDAVKAPFVDRLIRNIKELSELSKIEYIVCNHAEPDHSGGLPEMMKACTNATLLCNGKCREALSEYYETAAWKIEVVNPGTKIELGTRSLNFIDTPMVHWPESMFTYIPEDAILFSMDAFGQHLGTSVRFDDEWPLDDILLEAKSYYANIVNPYGRQVQKTLEAAAGLDIKMIASSHGVIWRSHIPEIIAAYKDWAGGKYVPKLLVFYDTMWDSTLRMTEAIVRGANSVSDAFDARSIHVRKTTLTRIAAEMIDAPAVAFGSATLNTQVMPQMAAVMTYIKGLKFRPKTSFAFGSSGWGIGGPELIRKWLEELKWNVIEEPLKARNRPTPEMLTRCAEIGAKLAQVAMEV